MRLLIDTNVYSELKRGNPKVAHIVRRGEQILLSAVVAGELLYGFRCGARWPKNLEELEAFLERPFVSFLPVSRTTSDRYSRIASGLRRKGTPVPSNDIWIAAHAMEVGADLISFDSHFSVIDGLSWVHLPTP